MRRSLLAGGVLAVAAVLVVLVSAALDLELESVALLGTALGAVVALVPDRSAGARLAGLAVGLVAAWIGYLVRAALLPDSVGGQAVAVAAVVLLCAAVAALTAGRLPLWSTLLGVVGLVGAYEAAYAAAPPEVAATSLSAVTALVLAVGAGFLAAGAVVPPSTEPRPRRRPGRATPAETSTSLDEMMETTR